jgi:hypothetical protein
MLTIVAVQTNDGYFISEKNSSYYDILMSRKFDSVVPVETFLKGWCFIAIDHKPLKVTHMEEQPDINYRYILKDDSLKSKKLPLELKKENVGHDDKDCEGGKIFVRNDEWSMYRSLYQEVSDPQPDKEVEEEFEFNIVFKVDKIEPPAKMEYPTNPLWIDHKSVPSNITNHNIEHQILDQIIFPTILLHETPCRLSSEDTYNLIRNYVKLNINPKHAKVTSDHSFCFEVKKIISITEPYTTTTTHKKYGRRRPIVETRLVSTREVKCFEMTSEKEMYSGYTPIKGFEAKNETELKEQIDAYLKDLMDYINKPLVDCPHCKGAGVLLNDKIKFPQR